MNHKSSDWEARPDRIIPDSDLNIDRLGWQAGDYFRVTNINGCVQLVKVDSLTQLVRNIGGDVAE
jgi:hypothetical protein